MYAKNGNSRYNMELLDRFVFRQDHSLKRIHYGIPMPIQWEGIGKSVCLFFCNRRKHTVYLPITNYIVKQMGVSLTG